MKVLFSSGLGLNPMSSRQKREGGRQGLEGPLTSLVLQVLIIQALMCLVLGTGGSTGAIGPRVSIPVLDRLYSGKGTHNIHVVIMLIVKLENK